MSNAKPVVRMEQWRVTNIGGGGDRLDGIVYGHHDPQCPDGSRCFSSELLSIDFAHSVAETKRSQYLLGTRAQ